MNNLFSELKRRNIFRVIGVYAVVGWLLIQMGIALETSLDMPSWFDKLVTTLVLIGFPVAIVLAWAFEMTPDGVKPTLKVAEGGSVTNKTGKTLIGVLVGLLAVALGVIGWQSFGPSKAEPQRTVQMQSSEKQRRRRNSRRAQRNEKKITSAIFRRSPQRSTKRAHERTRDED